MSFDLRRWLQHEALPVWSTKGFDHTTNMFVERLDLDGGPILDAPRRLMVQARQIYVFAESHLRGWYDGAAIAERAGQTMVRRFRFGGEGGWIHSVTARGESCDQTRDLYDQAFALLAFASLKRLTGSNDWLAEANATIRFLLEHMAAPKTGGYVEAIPDRAGPRRQNPHMHLLEAFLALHSVAPGAGYLRHANAMVELMTTRFVLGPSRVLVEFYDSDLRPSTSPPHSFEPGHHFEWAWLLWSYEKAGGSIQASSLRRHFRDHALRHGMSEDDTIIDEVGGDGEPISRSTRLWPYAEAARAVSLDLDRTDMAQRRAAAVNLGQRRVAAVKMISAMHDRFIAPAARGCWIDRLDADRKPLSADVPASSLYHIFGAATALEDLV